VTKKYLFRYLLLNKYYRSEISVQTQEPKELIKNPCVGVCCLDEHDLCIACKRSGIEIAEWGIYDQSEKKAVLIKIAERYKEEEL